MNYSRLKYIFCFFLFCFLKQSVANDAHIQSLFKKAHRTKISNFDSTIVYSDSILELAKKINDKHALAEAYQLKGLANYGKGNYPEALNNYQQSLTISEKNNFADLLFSLYNLLGTFYKKQNNLKAAQEQFNNEYNLAIKQNDSVAIGNALGDLGLIYELQDDWDKAEDCFQKALQIHQRNNCKKCESYALDYLSEIYTHRQKFDEAIALLEQALELKKSLADSSGIAMEINNIGEVYAAKGNPDKALNYFFQSLDYSIKINYPEFTTHIYKMISEMYLQQHNFEKAYHYYSLHVSVKDSIYNEQKTRIINEMDAKYQNEKKQLQIDNLNKQNEINEVKIENQTATTRSLYMLAGFLLVIVIFILIGFRNKQKANQIISQQKIEVEKQRDLVETKNKEITDSIHYAKRIQRALLASDTFLNNHFPEHFVFYKPKDIVSGDFYWANIVDNKFVMITADCTGHGVPGAFMSLLNISYLNEAIVQQQISSPEKFLEYIRTQIMLSLNSENMDEESKDGMDAVLCVFDFKHQWLRFACANNPLWIIRKEELIEFKPDKMPVGAHYGELKPFALNTIGLRKGDIVYTFTDGYADQFGGPKGKKFKYKQLNEILLNLKDQPISEQKQILESTFTKWRGGLEQVDDVLIIGIRL